MSTRGLIGFRYNEVDKLAYNHSDSQPDVLGLKILRELRAVDAWDTVADRVRSMITVEETQKLNDRAGIAKTEIRRYFPDLQYRGTPQDFYDLYQPLQGTLKPYLDGRLSFLPDASDFIHSSLHCEWAYIANLDDNRFEIRKGLQNEPEPENYRYPQEADRTGYYPCDKLKDYDLENLPKDGIFLSDYYFFKDLTSARHGDRS